MTPPETRDAVNAELSRRAQPVMSGYDWIGIVMVRGTVSALVDYVIRTRIGDAAFIANQREIDALLAEWAAEEQPELREAA